MRFVQRQYARQMFEVYSRKIFIKSSEMRDKNVF